MGLIVGLAMALLISLFNFSDDTDILHSHSQTAEDITKNDKHHHYTVPEINKDETASVAIALLASIVLLI